METLVLVFLLAYAGADEEMKNKLKNLLDLYRENRVLIQALMQNGGSMSAMMPSESPQMPPGKQQDRPPQEQEAGEQSTANGADLDILRRYLGGLH